MDRRFGCFRTCLTSSNPTSYKWIRAVLRSQAKMSEWRCRTFLWRRQSNCAWCTASGTNWFVSIEPVRNGRITEETLVWMKQATDLEAATQAQVTISTERPMCISSTTTHATSLAIPKKHAQEETLAARPVVETCRLSSLGKKAR